MKRSLLPLIAAFAAASLIFSACGDSAGSTAAKVGNTTITQKSLDDELNAIKNNKKYVDAITANGGPTITGTGKNTFNAAFVAQILNQRILLEVVKQELVKRKITLTEEDRRLAAAEIQKNFVLDGEDVSKAFPKSYQETLAERSASVMALRANLAGVKLDDAAVQEYYNANKGKFGETCTRHILVETQEKADALRARIVAGEDFAKVAEAESTDKASGAEGGKLGCDLSQFVSVFSDAAAKLAVNEISAPVRSQFGFHIIQVTSRVEKPLDDTVKMQVREALIGNDTTKLQDTVYEALAKAKVTVNPAIGKFDKGDKAAGKAPQVVPNEAPAAATTTTTTPGGAGEPGGAGGTGGAGGAGGAEPATGGSTGAGSTATSTP